MASQEYMPSGMTMRRAGKNIAIDGPQLQLGALHPPVSPTQALDAAGLQTNKCSTGRIPFQCHNDRCSPKLPRFELQVGQAKGQAQHNSSTAISADARGGVKCKFQPRFKPLFQQSKKGECCEVEWHEEPHVCPVPHTFPNFPLDCPSVT
eukprot:8807903-Ditylum_brightwellii.AAC.1